MSVKIIDQVWERYPGEGNELLIALAVADWANDNGEGIYPALATLAKKSRQSESSARRHIKHMLDRGWLVRVNRGIGGRAVTNEYRINPEWLKGVNLTPFHVEQRDGTKEGSQQPVEGQSEGSRTLENPSTAMTGYVEGNPSNLTPFQERNPSNLTGYSAERVSNEARKGVTAVTPDPLEPKNSDARAPARGRARATPEPEPIRRPDLDMLRPYWRSSILAEAQSAGSMHLPGSEPLWAVGDQLFPRWPGDGQVLRGTAAVAARELVDQLTERYAGREAAGERRNDLDREMRTRVFEALRQKHAASAA